VTNSATTEKKSELLDITAPKTKHINQSLEISVKLTKNNYPLPDKQITLRCSTDGGVSFYNIEPPKLDQGVTNEEGCLKFKNVQRSAGTYQYHACCESNKDIVSKTVNVKTVVTWGKKTTGSVIGSLLGLVIIPAILTIYAASGRQLVGLWWMLIVWLLIFLFIVIFMVGAGYGMTGRWPGLLIDERYRMSTSRLQLIVWTLVIVPALLAFIFINIGHGSPDAALNIAIPPELWALLGISGGAAVAAPVANAVTNQNKKVSDDAATRANTTVDGSDHVGVLDVNTAAESASFSDMFEGDEIGNRDHLDVSKVQMLVISIGLALGYGAAIAIMLAQAAHATPPALPLGSFPAVDPNLATLLLVSQGTYVAYKAAPHTQSADETKNGRRSP